MTLIGPRKERKRLARIVSLVISAMKNLANGDGCTIGKIVDYITDVGHQIAPKREVIAALKRGVEFGLMNKRRGRYFLKYKVNNVASLGDQFGKIAVNRGPTEKAMKTRAIERKLRRKKRRNAKPKYRNHLRRSPRKPPVKRLRKTRCLPTPNSYKLFDLYVNPSCRVSAKSSIASTQMFEQEESENCAA